MHPRQTNSAIPTDTLKTARATMGRNNFYLLVGDSWDALLSEGPHMGSGNKDSAKSWMAPTLAIATLLQYKEKLSDRQVEEASRLRVDWKYALHLSMYYPGLSRVMLCKYRQRIYHNPAWQVDFQSILDRFIERGLLHERQEASLTAVALLDEVCSQSRLEEIMLAQRRALEALATNHPGWLRKFTLPNWYSRYHLFKPVPDLPHRVTQQGALAETIGADILYLFDAISRSDQPELGELDEIRALKQIWHEQFEPAGYSEARRMPSCSFCGTLQAGSAPDR